MLHALHLGADAAGAAWLLVLINCLTVQSLRKTHRQSAPADALWPAKQICMPYLAGLDVLMQHPDRPIMPYNLPTLLNFLHLIHTFYST